MLGAEALVRLVDPVSPRRPTWRRALTERKTAVYKLRWVNTRGEKRRWSEITTATVVGRELTEVPRIA